MVDAIASALGTAGQVGAGSRASLAENFEMFLVLLTEQLKNQDPLSPLDSNQFVSQLVEFSSVEQLINQNDTLDKLVGLQVASVGGATVSYLGKEIRVAAPEAQLTATGAHWAYSVGGQEDPKTVTLTVTNAEGKVVYTADGSKEPGEHGFSWNGKDNDGEPLPPGPYTLEVSALTETSKSLPTYVASFGIVTGLDLSGPEPVLLIGEARAPFSQIEAVRDPLPYQAEEPPETDPETEDEGA